MSTAVTMETFYLLIFTFLLLIWWVLNNQKLCKDFNKYFQDIFLTRGTRRVVIKPFGNFLVTTVAMATPFLYCFGTCDFVGTLHSEPVHRY